MKKTCTIFGYLIATARDQTHMQVKYIKHSRYFVRTMNHHRNYPHTRDIANMKAFKARGKPCGNE